MWNDNIVMYKCVIRNHYLSILNWQVNITCDRLFWNWKRILLVLRRKQNTADTSKYTMMRRLIYIKHNLKKSKHWKCYVKVLVVCCWWWYVCEGGGGRVSIIAWLSIVIQYWQCGFFMNQILSSMFIINKNITGSGECSQNAHCF